MNWFTRTKWNFMNGWRWHLPWYKRLWYFCTPWVKREAFFFGGSTVGVEFPAEILRCRENLQKQMDDLVSIPESYTKVDGGTVLRQERMAERIMLENRGLLQKLSKK